MKILTIIIFLILATITGYAKEEQLQVNVSVPKICNLYPLRNNGNNILYKRMCNTEHRINVDGVVFGVYPAKNDTIELPQGAVNIQAL